MSRAVKHPDTSIVFDDSDSEQSKSIGREYPITTLSPAKVNLLKKHNLDYLWIYNDEEFEIVYRFIAAEALVKDEKINPTLRLLLLELQDSIKSDIKATPACASSYATSLKYYADILESANTIVRDWEKQPRTAVYQSALERLRSYVPRVSGYPARRIWGARIFGVILIGGAIAASIFTAGGLPILAGIGLGIVTIFGGTYWARKKSSGVSLSLQNLHDFASRVPEMPQSQSQSQSQFQSQIQSGENQPKPNSHPVSQTLGKAPKEVDYKRVESLQDAQRQKQKVPTFFQTDQKKAITKESKRERSLLTPFVQTRIEPEVVKVPEDSNSASTTMTFCLRGKDLTEKDLTEKDSVESMGEQEHGGIPSKERYSAESVTNSKESDRRRDSVTVGVLCRSGSFSEGVASLVQPKESSSSEEDRDSAKNSSSHPSDSDRQDEENLFVAGSLS